MSFAVAPSLRLGLALVAALARCCSSSGSLLKIAVDYLIGYKCSSVSCMAVHLLWPQTSFSTPGIHCTVLVPEVLVLPVLFVF